MLDFFAQLLLFVFNLGTELVQSVHLLVQLVNCLVLQRVIAVFGVKLLDQSLELLLLGLDVDRVTF